MILFQIHLNGVDGIPRDFIGLGIGVRVMTSGSNPHYATINNLKQKL
jgi:hypothetical protein